LQLERLVQRPDQLVREHRRALVAFQVPRNHQELVSTEAPERVLPPADFLQALRHQLQQFVARSMAQRVVHALELVEIDEQHGDHFPRATGDTDRLFQAFEQQRAVRQGGQRIIVRKFLQFLLRLDGFREIDEIAERGAPVCHFDHFVLHPHVNQSAVVAHGTANEGTRYFLPACLAC
jgi:hypothetical protein